MSCNQYYIESQEYITENLSKAEALLTIALHSNFNDYTEAMAHYYLWAILDYISQAKHLSETLLIEMLKKNYGR